MENTLKKPLESAVARKLPVGAEASRNGAHFRVWAPKCHVVSVLLEDAHEHALAPERDGYFAAQVNDAAPGTRYRFRLDGASSYPDPASRFQPEGPDGPSEVIDSASFGWSDQDWGGIDPERVVVYELHIGTFTREGTWSAAARELQPLAELGVTVIELMPVADFPGRFGWGYDGVDLFAPTRLYGRPDDMRRFVDAAHRLGIGVILDVVYNHLGPEGNYLGAFSDAYTTDRYDNEWGDALNFDGADSAPVREFFLANAGHWIDEFHLDGLRLDATQQIFDRSEEHIVTAIRRRVREAAGRRRTWVVAENEPQEASLITRDGIDALWNDDLHHAAIVALTGRREAYYSDYLGNPQELVSAAKHHFLYQGQHFAWQKKRRGTPALGVTPHSFVQYLQNHDQVANSASGARVHELAAPGALRAMTAYLLLCPASPMLFMGQEFNASAPFLYFADHEPDLARKVRHGRRDFLAQFPSLADMRERLAVPHDESTFFKCKLDHSERVRNEAVWRLHRDLLRLRREDRVFAGPRPGGLDGAVLGREALVLRFLGGDEGDRLLLVNLGPDLPLTPVSEPLLAPPRAVNWRLLWHSEDPDYGGSGAPSPESGDGKWRLPGRAAVVMTSHD
jgi:maltooligosyltrehalose trehalohydrolase